MADNPIPTNLNYGPELTPQPDFPTPRTDYSAPTPNPVPAVDAVGGDPYAAIYADFNKDMAGYFKKKDYYKEGAPTAFNAEALLFDKYESTNHGIFSGIFSDFDEKGFIPWRDNEETYNQDSNFMKEMYRSTKWAAPLFGEGFVSGMRQMPDLIAGMYNGDMSQIFKTDDYLAAEWARATKMGGSTMNATSAFFTNFEISAANMLGTIAEMAVEDAILAGITAASGGTATPGTVAAATIKGANVFKNIYNGLKDLGKTYDVFKNAQTARRFFEVTNAGRTLANTAQAINPLRQTTDFAVNMFRGTEAGTGLGKTVKGFGNFYRDIREINFALTEAKLEGGFSFLEQKQMLTEEYQLNNNGLLPQGEEARRIEENARAAGDFTTKANLGVIYASNRIGFGNMFKGYSPLNKLMAEASDSSIFRNIDFNKTKEIFEEATSFSLKRAYRKGVGGLANYFKANISEGLQEGVQEMIQGASKDYYTKQFRTPAYGGANIMMADIAAQIQPKIFSGEGFQTIASGFLMGSVVGGGSKAFSGIADLTYRAVKPEQYKEFRKQRDETIKKYVSELNEIYKDPLKFFDPQLLNMPNQGAISQYLAQAVKNRNQKMFYDIKDQSVYGHLSTLIRSGKADVFRDRLNEMKQLTPDEFQEALGHPIDNPEDFKGYIDEKLKQLDHIEKLYNEATTKLVNPINLKAYKKKGGKDYERARLDYIAFENARDQAIFANYTFMRTGERMLDLLGKISKSKLLGKSNYLDLSMLTSPTLLEQEIKNLTKEAQQMLEGDAESREMAKDKLKRLRTLQLWSRAMNPKTLSVDPDGTKITEKSKFPVDYPSLDNPAYENWRLRARLAFEAIVSTEAGIQKDSVYRENLDQVFDYIMDYHTMDKESENMREALNILADPANFLKLYDGHTAQVRELYAKRFEVITEAINNALAITDQNSLVYKLAKIMVVEDPQNPGTYLKEGPNGWAIVDPASDDYKQIMDIVDDYNKTVAPPPPPAPVATGANADIEAKKADIERRRQEELKVNAYRIPVTRIGQKWVDDDGTNFQTVLTTFADGSKETVVKNLDTNVNTPKQKYSAELSDEKILEAESAASAVSREPVENVEIRSDRVSESINAKYDAELAALEGAKPAAAAPAAPAAPAGKEPSMLRIHRRRIAAAASVEDLNRIAVDIQKKGLIQGLSQEQIDELQKDIMDAIERLANKDKEEAEKGQAFLDELKQLLRAARTREDLTAAYMSFINSTKSMTQDQIDEIDQELQRLFKMFDSGQNLENAFAAETQTEQQYSTAIEAAGTVEDLQKVHDQVVSDKSLDQPTKNKLIQQIKDKSSIFVDDSSTTEPYSTNTVFDLSNIDQFDASVFDAQINNMTGSTPASTAVNEDVQNLEDDMFDDISSCNIIP
jgi:hypothetical protein